MDKKKAVNVNTNSNKVPAQTNSYKKQDIESMLKGLWNDSLCYKSIYLKKKLKNQKYFNHKGFWWPLTALKFDIFFL